jgi:pimeloyl-ACP methyl ester carboxylesterase
VVSVQLRFQSSRKRRWTKAIGVILSAVIVVLAGWFLWPAYTPQIRDAQGQRVPNSIASLERVTLGGVSQSILIRGWNQNNPILLMLHGGPGMPQMYLAYRFQRELEKNFVVVQWDRRGAGKSYSGQVPPQSLTVDQLVNDTHQLVALLRDRFHQPKIFLAGHSWGTYLGMLVVQRYPDLFYAYVGMGQMTDSEQGRKLRHEFLLRHAHETGNQRALRDLEEGSGSDEKWLFQFGGELRHATSWWTLLALGLRAPEYTAADAFRIPAGLRLYSQHMDYNGHGELVREVSAVQVPVYFFLGRYDYNTPSELAAAYLQTLSAPSKKLVWFEESAHFPFLEEPAKFAAEMTHVLADIQASSPKSQ